MAKIQGTLNDPIFELEFSDLDEGCKVPAQVIIRIFKDLHRCFSDLL